MPVGEWRFGQCDGLASPQCWAGLGPAPTDGREVIGAGKNLSLHVLRLRATLRVPRCACRSGRLAQVGRIPTRGSGMTAACEAEGGGAGENHGGETQTRLPLGNDAPRVSLRRA